LQVQLFNLNNNNYSINNNSNNSINNNKMAVHLFCTGPDNTFIDCTKRGDDNVSIGIFDTFRLIADIENFYASPSSCTQENTSGMISSSNNNSNKPIIIEVFYDEIYGMWSYKVLRKDKVIPNYIDSVIGF
jgi:hypothetical protein